MRLGGIEEEEERRGRGRGRGESACERGDIPCIYCVMGYGVGMGPPGRRWVQSVGAPVAIDLVVVDFFYGSSVSGRP